MEFTNDQFDCSSLVQEGEYHNLVDSTRHGLQDKFEEMQLVLDGATCLNMLPQAREFEEVGGGTSLILTKLDGSVKGGCVTHIRLGIPVKFVGVGEPVEDDADAFVNAISFPLFLVGTIPTSPWYYLYDSVHLPRSERIILQDDGYIPKHSVLELQKAWTGSEVRWVTGGHVSSFLLHNGEFRRAIVDSLDGLPGKESS
ncbi:hypothetical protein PIB30_080339 [Stylosanthes scabra]|uniref:SRP54-type proteins GTP-binding domain-containing protein n=1 Tax=Stylosanthes scabra TaxID=79078 RepID=A0ABU6SSY3_9FABA|nr:hypothetical protein [Stylosanthes scabra]